MGVPVITGDSPAIRELLTDGVDVVLVERGNPAALAGAILQARADYPRMAQIGLRGRETFLTQAAPACVSRVLGDSVATLLH
jgi:glycosyltransferase involved in cell wall biosynthesis